MGVDKISFGFEVNSKAGLRIWPSKERAGHRILKRAGHRILKRAGQRILKPRLYLNALLNSQSQASLNAKYTVLSSRY